MLEEREKVPRILVEGLPLRATDYNLTRAFRKWGELVEHCVMMDKRTRKSRGFGFITFLTRVSHDLCMSEPDHHFIFGCKIILRSIDKIAKNYVVEKLRTKRLFVSFSGCNLKRKDLLDYFLQFGDVTVQSKIKDVREQRFAYLVFDNEESGQACFELGQHWIKGQKIHVKKLIREEDLRKAEQMERERILRAENQKIINKTMSDGRKSSLNMPSTSCTATPIVKPSLNSSPRENTRINCWVPLLHESYSTVSQDPSYLAGYGPRKTAVSDLNRPEPLYGGNYEWNYESGASLSNVPVTQISAEPYMYDNRYFTSSS